MLTIGQSRVVTFLLHKVASKGRHLSVVVLEGRPDTTGAKVAKSYTNAPEYPPRLCWNLQLGM